MTASRRAGMRRQPQRGTRTARCPFGLRAWLRATLRWDNGHRRWEAVLKTIVRRRAWRGPAIPPGEVLLEEFLKPLGLWQVEAAQLGISANRLNEVVLGKRRITPDTALRLSRFLKTSPQFWMRLQADWDLHRAAERAAS